MHYERLRRIGSLDLPPRNRYYKAHGYVVIKRPDHPLASPKGWVYEHRAVLYDMLGPGSHPCFWCGKVLEWGQRLHADHLDHDRSNNAPINLVPSCLACNSARKEGDQIERWADLLATREVLRNHAEELETVKQRLLAQHHSQVTAREQPGGFNG
jgi:hypothetical protein